MAEEVESAAMSFACGPDNPIGLKIDLSFDGETCTGEFTPNENHVSCEIRYRQPLRIGEGVLLTGWTESRRGRLLNLRGEVRRKSDDVLVAECASSFLLEK